MAELLTITKGQAVPEHPELEVFEGGQFDPEALVYCNKIGEDTAFAAFQAKFVVGGGDVYAE